MRLLLVCACVLLLVAVVLDIVRLVQTTAPALLPQHADLQNSDHAARDSHDRIMKVIAFTRRHRPELIGAVKEELDLDELETILYTAPMNSAPAGFINGDFKYTGRQLDLAIEGDGFFAFTQEDGTTAYTRGGDLALRSSDGVLITRGMHIIQPKIVIPSETEQVLVGSDGIVTVLIGNRQHDVGQLLLSRFDNPAALKVQGMNTYLPTTASGPAHCGVPDEAGFGKIHQGRLEMVDTTQLQVHESYAPGYRGVY